MSDDDWSLNKVGSYRLNGTLLKPGVEKLHEELISEVKELFINYDYAQDFTDEVSEIINKKFGVKV